MTSLKVVARKAGPSTSRLRRFAQDEIVKNCGLKTSGRSTGRACMLRSECWHDACNDFGVGDGFFSQRWSQRRSVRRCCVLAGFGDEGVEAGIAVE
jgi:hypothetical protein